MQQLASKEFLMNRQDDSQEIRHKKLMKTTQEKATSNRFFRFYSVGDLPSHTDLTSDKHHGRPPPANTQRRNVADC